MNSLHYEHFKTSYTPLPPDDEIDHIVAFLDQKTAEIDAWQQKAAHYAPMARHLILSRSTDIQGIEHTLDHLLDVACIPDGLAPFKTLCRYYYGIDPAATATYVHAYRDMWDSEPAQAQEVAVFPEN